MKGVPEFGWNGGVGGAEANKGCVERESCVGDESLQTPTPDMAVSLTKPLLVLVVVRQMQRLKK